AIKVSLIPLKIGATGNRSLVLLPFFVFISAIFLNDLWKLNHKFYFYILISIVLSIQILESFSWVSIKLSQDPRLSSSIWIKENVQKGSVIGLENIPIYQMLPDIVLKEYYAKEKDNNNYKYQILESSSNTLPKIIIITNREFDENFVMESPKKSLITRLNKEGYMVTQEFYPNLKFNSLFNNYLNFYISALVPSSTITLYTKK
ncbi:MAG: hypothetical protein M1326_00005, partial [Cyanobacteria bacterium]|nr:hypothetical protein [Cyanobacteriota bacterium]